MHSIIWHYWGFWEVSDTSWGTCGSKMNVQHDARCWHCISLVHFVTITNRVSGCTVVSMTFSYSKIRTLICFSKSFYFFFCKSVNEFYNSFYFMFYNWFIFYGTFFPNWFILFICVFQMIQLFLSFLLIFHFQMIHFLHVSFSNDLFIFMWVFPNLDIQNSLKKCWRHLFSSRDFFFFCARWRLIDLTAALFIFMWVFPNDTKYHVSVLYIGMLTNSMIE